MSRLPRPTSPWYLGGAMLMRGPAQLEECVTVMSQWPVDRADQASSGHDPPSFANATHIFSKKERQKSIVLERQTFLLADWSHKEPWFRSSSSPKPPKHLVSPDPALCSAQRSWGTTLKQRSTETMQPWIESDSMQHLTLQQCATHSIARARNIA